MKNLSWPLALMVTVAMLVIGAVAILQRDVAAVSSAILTILVALGLAELREIKSSTNGSNDRLMQQNKALMEELSEYRRSASRFTDRALDSQPMVPSSSVPSSTTTSTTTTSTTTPV
jgi:hypothetical protein